MSAYAKYISKDIVVPSPYPEITAPAIDYRGVESDSSLHFQWSCITKPVLMDLEPEVSDKDQFLLFASSNTEDTTEFEAQVELPIGARRRRFGISEPAFVYIPAGLPYGPIDFKSIRKPVTLWRWSLGTEYSEHWMPDDHSMLIVKPGLIGLDGSASRREGPAPQDSLDAPPNITINESDGTPMRTIRIPPMSGVSCWCKPLGIQAALSTGYFVVKNRDYCTIEPIHYHTRFDEWLIFLGGDPLDVSRFDARVEIFWGREQEMQTVDAPCVAHVPAGLVHIGQDHRRVGRPYYESIVVAGTGDYFAESDKVVISREEKGEPVIPVGARDYVPATRED